MYDGIFSCFYINFFPPSSIIYLVLPGLELVYGSVGAPELEELLGNVRVEGVGHHIRVLHASKLKKDKIKQSTWSSCGKILFTCILNKTSA